LFIQPFFLFRPTARNSGLWLFATEFTELHITALRPPPPPHARLSVAYLYFKFKFKTEKSKVTDKFSLRYPTPQNNPIGPKKNAPLKKSAGFSKSGGDLLAKIPTKQQLFFSLQSPFLTHITLPPLPSFALHHHQPTSSTVNKHHHEQ